MPRPPSTAPLYYDRPETQMPPSQRFLQDFGYDRATGLYGAVADGSADPALNADSPTPYVQPLPLPSATPRPVPTATPGAFGRALPPRLPSVSIGMINALPTRAATPAPGTQLTYTPEQLAAYNAAHAHLLDGTVPTDRVMVNGQPVPRLQPGNGLRPGATAADPSAGGRYGEAGQNYGMTNQQAAALLAWSQRAQGDVSLQPDETGYQGDSPNAYIMPGSRSPYAQRRGFTRATGFTNNTGLQQALARYAGRGR